MDINSFVTGFSMGKKKGGSGGGGKDPVLGELTVTENGVYDKPVIAGGNTITWDGVVSNKVVVFLEGEDLSDPDTMAFVKVSDMILSADAYVGSAITLTYADGGEITITLEPSHIVEMGGVLVAGEFFVLTVPKANFASNLGLLPADIVFPEAGTYFAYLASQYVTSVTFTGDFVTTPADGWNKVTVNVAGDIVDVPELPTENIEEGKIYRVTKEGEPVTEIWHSISPEMIEENGMSGTMETLMRNDDYIRALMGPDVAYELHVVDTLPEVGVPSVFGQIFHVYVVNDESSEAYLFIEGSGWFSGRDADFGFYMGTVDNMADIKEDTGYTVAYYILKRAGQSSTTYGIPNAHPVKRLVDGAWVELT